MTRVAVLIGRRALDAVLVHGGQGGLAQRPPKGQAAPVRREGRAHLSRAVRVRADDAPSLLAGRHEPDVLRAVAVRGWLEDAIRDPSVRGGRDRWIVRGAQDQGRAPADGDQGSDGQDAQRPPTRLTAFLLGDATRRRRLVPGWIGAVFVIERLAQDVRGAAVRGRYRYASVSAPFHGWRARNRVQGDLELVQGAREHGAHVGRGGPQDLGDRPVVVVVVVTEDHGRSVARRQAVERIEEGEPARRPGRVVGCDEPRQVGVPLRLRPAAHGRQRLVDHDPVQPGLRGGVSAEAIALTVGGDVGLLGDIGGECRVTDDAQRRPIGALVRLLVEGAEIRDLEAKGHRFAPHLAEVKAPGHTLETRRGPKHYRRPRGRHRFRECRRRSGGLPEWATARCRS